MPGFKGLHMKLLLRRVLVAPQNALCHMHDILVEVGEERLYEWLTALGYD